MKTNQENFKIVDINDLADVCGFFNGKTPVNNGYGCNHPNVEDSEMVRIIDGEEHRTGDSNKVIKVALRKKYGSFQNIEKALATEEGTQYLQLLRNDLTNDNSFLKDFGCKIIGKCYSFSCPIATRCDVQDLREYGSDFLSDYEDQDDDYRTELMLVTDPKLIEKL